MRPVHASHYGIVSEVDFVKQRPEEDTILVEKFGSFTAETVCSEDLHGITIYCDNVHSGITGMCLHTFSGPRHIGADTTMPKFFPLHGPNEIVTEFRVWQHLVHAPAVTVSL